MGKINWVTVLAGVVVGVATFIQPVLLAGGAQPNYDWRGAVLSAAYLAAVWLTRHVKNS